MQLLGITYAIATFFIVVVSLSKYGKVSDDLARRKKFIDGKGTKVQAVDELNDSFFNRFIKPAVDKVQETFAKINSKESKVGKKSNTTETIENQLRLAGIEMSAEAFTFYKQVFMAIVLIITLFLFLALEADMLIKLFILALGAIIALIVPIRMLTMLAASRQEAIRVQIPDALDLLGVCIEAGLSFDSSLLKVSEKIEGPFIDELLIVYREIQMGVPRNDALKKLSDGSNIPELKTFISALIQANQLGIPINNVMNVQSAQLRETRKQQAREKGAKAPVKILIPMVGLIFPVLFIILMGPTVLNIIEML